jgi:uncharacterized membrane protein YjgN (DUF898 family)
MNDFASPGFSATIVPIAAPPAGARFTGAMRAFRKVILRGALLQVVTVGIYRFWLTTDARRFLGANTEIGGDSLEYTGTAMELFLGFLMAIALLVPVYVLLFIGTLELGLVSQLSSLAAFAFLAVFGQYAYYRARRYRLTRTVFRGVRLHQSGSPWSYALRTLLWWILIANTLGLAYPWAQASLERYKLAHTHYGEWQGEFAGSGTRLFVRGIGLWLIMIAAIAAFAAVGSQFVDPAAINRATRATSPDAAATKAILVAMGLGFGIMVVAAVVYTLLQAIIMRWWLAGLRFGPLVVTTTLKKRRIFGAYVRCFLYTLLLLIALSIVAGIIVAIVTAVMAAEGAAKPSPDTSQALVIAATAAAYLTLAIGVWVIYQMTIKFRIWRLCVESVAIAGFDAIERVHADRSRPSSAVGEGLADALGAGGI